MHDCTVNTPDTHPDKLALRSTRSPMRVHVRACTSTRGISILLVVEYSPGGVDVVQHIRQFARRLKDARVLLSACRQRARAFQ